MTSETP